MLLGYMWWVGLPWYYTLFLLGMGMTMFGWLIGVGWTIAWMITGAPWWFPLAYTVLSIATVFSAYRDKARIYEEAGLDCSMANPAAGNGTRSNDER